MAIERFTWATEKGAEGDIAQRVRSKKFGDGYEQSVEDGINNRTQSWPVTFTGLKPRIKDIMAFWIGTKGPGVSYGSRLWASWASTSATATSQCIAGDRSTPSPSPSNKPFIPETYPWH